MKAVQSRKLQLNVNKSIKLKFDNIKTEEEPNAFTEKDLQIVDEICKDLSMAIKNNLSISQTDMLTNLGMMKKLRRALEESGQPDSSKIKFRIVKSAKKSNSQIKRPEEFQQIPRPTALPFVNLIENKSQFYEMKENLPQIEDNKSTIVGKVKLKRLGESRRMQNGETNEVRSITNEEVISKIKVQLKRVSMTCESKDKQIENLNARMLGLEEQNSNLRQLIESKDITNQNITLDVKFSLKCIEAPHIQTISQKQVMSESRSLNPNSQLKKKYEDEMMSQMRMMIITQNKEIESLCQKVVDRQESFSMKKSGGSRWQTY